MYHRTMATPDLVEELHVYAMAQMREQARSRRRSRPRKRKFRVASSVHTASFPIRRPTLNPYAYALAKAMEAKVEARFARAARPLPDEPRFNEETMQAIRDTEAGIGVSRYKDAAEMFADMGL